MKYSDTFPGRILPVRNGIYRTYDADLRRWYFNQFKNGQWYWGWNELSRCQDPPRWESMDQSNVSRWYGLAKPSVLTEGKSK